MSHFTNIEKTNGNTFNLCFDGRTYTATTKDIAHYNNACGILSLSGKASEIKNAFSFDKNHEKNFDILGFTDLDKKGAYPIERYLINNFVFQVTE